jgi:hypothetical protein
MTLRLMVREAKVIEEFNLLFAISFRTDEVGFLDLTQAVKFYFVLVVRWHSSDDKTRDERSNLIRAVGVLVLPESRLLDGLAVFNCTSTR